MGDEQDPEEWLPAESPLEAMDDVALRVAYQSTSQYAQPGLAMYHAEIVAPPD